MSRSWYTLPHVAPATTTASGAASSPVRVGFYESGQLHIRVLSVAGAGAWIQPFWQSSLGGTGGWGDLSRGSTLTATGTRVIAVAGGIGNYGRVRWRQSATGLRWFASFSVKE